MCYRIDKVLTMLKTILPSLPWTVKRAQSVSVRAAKAVSTESHGQHTEQQVNQLHSDDTDGFENLCVQQHTICLRNVGANKGL